MNIRLIVGLFTFVATTLAITTAAEVSRLAAPPAVVGTWKLVSCESRSDDGKVTLTYGPNPVGVLMYDAGGRMSVHLMSQGRPHFASDVIRGGSAAELKAAFDTYISYFGTYQLSEDGGVVSHHLAGCSYPNWVGTTQMRFLKLEGKRLSLSTPPQRIDGAEVRVFLIWEKVD